MKSSPETIRRAMGWPEPVEATIDHAARAQQLIDASMTLTKLNAEVPLILATAQVHATLALAHEQRTNNLITLIGYGEELGRDDASTKDAALYAEVAARLDLS